MKRILNLLLIFCIIGCSNDSQRHNEIKDTVEVVKLLVKPIDKKYYFSIFVFIQPTIETQQEEYGKSFYYKYDFHTSTSIISDIVNWDDDMKYKILDANENLILKDFMLYDNDNSKSKDIQYGTTRKRINNVY